MTFEERLAALGVDLSDLPQSDGCHLTYDWQSRSMAEQEVYRFAGMSGQFVDIIDCLKMHQDYILHLTGIIDRMETRLDNVTGELDHLKKICTDCRDCCSCENYGICDDEDIECSQYYSAYEYAGVPEDWSVDDD